jgi:hypothetical protein
VVLLQSAVPALQASHRLDHQSGRVVRSGLSAGQAEAARAARVSMARRGLAPPLPVAVAGS